MRLEVERELYLSAPQGVAVYAINPSYTSADGHTLLESISQEALCFAADGDKWYYHPRMFRRRSEDGGRTWREEPDLAAESAQSLDGAHRAAPSHILDVTHNRLISLYATYEVDTSDNMFQRGSQVQRTYRIQYEISDDGGATWTEPRQLIDSRPEYDAVHWGPSITYGESGGIASGDVVFMEDGTFVFGLTVSNAPVPETADTPVDREGYWAVMYAQARWNATCDDLEFTFGDMIRVDPGRSLNGCCESTVASLGGERLFNTMRCQGDEASGLFTTRYSTVSEDGGLSWSAPEPLHYDDGTTVWTPASYSQYITSSKTGRTYWLANILPGPVHGQMPRYPLAIAEFDTQRCCVLKDTVQPIIDLPPGAPEQRRYTNWGSYEERETGDLILTLPEQPRDMDFTAMTRPEDFTADCLRLRVRL